MNKLSERHFFLTQISSFNLASELSSSAAVRCRAAVVRRRAAIFFLRQAGFGAPREAQPNPTNRVTIRSPMRRHAPSSSVTLIGAWPPRAVFSVLESGQTNANRLVGAS